MIWQLDHGWFSLIKDKIKRSTRLQIFYRSEYKQADHLIHLRDLPVK